MERLAVILERWSRDSAHGSITLRMKEGRVVLVDELRTTRFEDLPERVEAPPCPFAGAAGQSPST